MNADENIKKLGINLPAAADPVGSYVATKIFGKQISTASVNVFVDDLIKKKILKKLSSSEIKKYQNRQGLK